MIYVLIVVIYRTFRSSAPLGEDNADEEETTVLPVTAPPQYSQDGSGHRVFISVLMITPDNTFQHPGASLARVSAPHQQNRISRDSKLSTNNIPTAIPL